MPQKTHLLRDLLDGLAKSGMTWDISGPDEIEITAVTADSRKAAEGTIFAALKGVQADGAVFAPKAVAAGAGAVIAGRDASLSELEGATVVRVDEPRRALSLIAAQLFPRQPDTAVAVTGTSGKTSTVDFTRQIWNRCGARAASVGTVGVIRPDGAVFSSLTTPDPVSLHTTLQSLADDGITHLSFEASSHGLEQHRLDGVRLKAGAFTNLGRDHLDYHPTIEDYFEAKMRLFDDLLQPGDAAVINMDGARSDEVAKRCDVRGLSVVRVGRAGDVLRLKDVRHDGFRQILSLDFDGRPHEIALPLIGGYQVENALVAAGLAFATGTRADKVLEALSDLDGVAGRLEIVGKVAGGLAVVDYAHKPEALVAALDAARPFATKRLITIVGCGGDRDTGKRPIMGGIAVEKSDVVIVTDDNPRTEDPARIRAAIMANAPGAMEIGDRRTAIKVGVYMLSEGDVLLVAGKGHETGQIIGTETLPFSDHAEIAKAIAIRSGLTGAVA